VLPIDVYDIPLGDALSFIRQQEKRRKDELTYAAQIGYASGLVARTSFGKAPVFEKLFPSLKVEQRQRSAEEYKAAMMQFAVNLNKKYK
jgi:hypothetical protein